MRCSKDGSAMRAVLVATDFTLWACLASAHEERLGAPAPKVRTNVGVAHDPLGTALRALGRYGAERRCNSCRSPAVAGESRCAKCEYARWRGRQATRSAPGQHGERKTYLAGCHCEACTKANRHYQRAYNRQRRRGAS